MKIHLACSGACQMNISYASKSVCCSAFKKSPLAVATSIILILGVSPSYAQVTQTGDTTSSGGALIVGNNGIGDVQISSGSVVSNADTTIGSQAGSSGVITVDGLGSTLNSSNGITVGDSGSGTLSIKNGASVTQPSILFLPFFVGNTGNGTGTVTVDGVGTKLNAGGLYLGVTSGSSGNISVTNAGAVEAVRLSVGGFIPTDTPGGSGTVLVTGSNSTLKSGRGGLYVGATASSSGDVSIANGGKVTSNNSSIGYNGGDASVRIDGVGSSWVEDESMGIGGSETGAFSTGNLLIQNGASATVKGSSFIGLNSASGMVNVAGAGSSFNSVGEVYLGYGSDPLLSSSGLINIVSGGKVSVGSNLIQGYNTADAIGTVNVSGAGSSLSVAGTMIVGSAGTGALNIADSGVVALTSSLQLAVDAGSVGTLNIGAVPGSSPFAPGTLDVSSVVFGAGTGAINFNHTGDNYTFAPAITGAGTVSVLSGTTVLTGANTYSGDTFVTNGILKAGIADTFSASSVYSVAQGAKLDTVGFDQTLAGLNNGGIVSLVSTQPGSTLTVNNAYVGNGGVLALGTGLSAQGISDRLVLDGANASASGSTNIAITNLGGLGGQTNGNGIEVVTAQNGGTTTSTAFSLLGTHVDAGAFEYRLYNADANGVGDNWYLRSDIAQAGNPVVTYRAEVPLYAAQADIIRQSDLEMLSDLNKRRGDDTRDGSTQVWARAIGGNLDIRQGGVANVDSHSKISGLQIGIDLFANQNWTSGFYVGQLHTDSSVSGNVGGEFGHAGSIKADGTYVGGYVTYKDETGLYADTVLQYGRQNVNSKASRTSTSNDANSWTASMEVGKRYPLGKGWDVEPQAQLVYNHLDIDGISISGARVTQSAKDQVNGRVGIRVVRDFQTSAGLLQPYGRINVWHGFSGDDKTTFSGPAGSTSINSGIGYTSTELATGFTLGLTSSASIYGEVGKMIKVGGSNSDLESDIHGSLGVKLSF